MDRFIAYLQDVHFNVNSMIYQSNDSQQGHLVHQLVNWAKKIAQSPLSSSDGGSNTRGFSFDKNEVFPSDDSVEIN